MKQGFVLIEVLLALVIAVMMGGILLEVLYQSNRGLKTVDGLIDTRERWIIGSQIIARDLAGACIPLQAEYQEKPQQPQKKAEQSQKPEQQTETPEPEKQLPKPLTKLFAAETKDGMLSTLTFITNNPLPVYDRGDTGIVKPKIVRVLYTVKLDKDSDKARPTYTLYREETVALEAPSSESTAGKNSPKSYSLMSDIKSITMTYTADMSSKEENNKKETPAAEDRWKTFTEWNVEKEGGTKELVDKNSILPTLVEVTCTFWKPGTKQEQRYSCLIAIEGETHLVPRKASAPPTPPPAKEQEAAQLPKAQQQGQQQVTVTKEQKVASSRPVRPPNMRRRTSMAAHKPPPTMPHPTITVAQGGAA